MIGLSDTIIPGSAGQWGPPSGGLRRFRVLGSVLSANRPHNSAVQYVGLSVGVSASRRSLILHDLFREHWRGASSPLQHADRVVIANRCGWPSCSIANYGYFNPINLLHHMWITCDVG